ncbi:hypothetical protein Tsubulata_028915 [Turnera subulata]|uniref:Uncharacterized protein n=1 Tax=Turnera subulata TaxID=218843 RepID=A0A9Q0GHZ2_9ROSI|nr:hypothetical protein Tsubulata_028915 [Turnera subulata]
MEEDDCKENPSEINSFYLNKPRDMRVLYLSKKRKLQAEQLESPTSKHKCCYHRLHPEPITNLEANHKAEDLIKQNAEGQTTEEGSDPESAKDSNSVDGDSDFVISTCKGGKFVSKVSNIWPPDRPSTSSLVWDNCGSSSSKDTQCSSDSVTSKRGTDKDAPVEHEACHNYDALQLPQNLEEAFLEFQSHLDYSCTEYENKGGIDPCVDKEFQDILYPNGANPNVYVLSSGRWSVGQDGTQEVTRKPTIDQEFEEYFSMLML